MPVPSLKEQREVADVFAALDRKEKVYERKKQSLTDLFRTLLYQLMTVQIRVHDRLTRPDDERNRRELIKNERGDYGSA